MSKLNEKTKKIFKWTKANALLTVGIVVIMIPIIFFVIILIQAYAASGSPLNGNRLNNERSVEISQAQIEEVDTALSSIADIDNVTIELKVSTMRVYVDVKDSVTADQYESLLNILYTKIDNILPVATYFTKQDTMKQYDLEIHAYNDTSLADTDGYIYYIMNKNAAMTLPETELVSAARNQELADELRGDTVSSGTVDGEDTEANDAAAQ